MSFESDHLRISRFSYILVSFMKEKLFLKNFVLYWIYNSLLKLCWYAAICSKLFSEWNLKRIFQLSPGWHINMFVLKMIKKKKVGIYPSMWSSKLHYKPCPKTLKKQKVVPTLGIFKCKCFHCYTTFFSGFDRPHGCLKLYHSLSMWYFRGSLEIRGPTC